jgi:hypothetical protein
VTAAFTIAFVGLCRVLEQQHKVMPDTIAEALHTEMGKVPTGSNLHSAAVKDMVTNLAKAVNGAAIRVGILV